MIKINEEFNSAYSYKISQRKVEKITKVFQCFTQNLAYSVQNKPGKIN